MFFCMLSSVSWAKTQFLVAKGNILNTLVSLRASPHDWPIKPGTNPSRTTSLQLWVDKNRLYSSKRGGWGSNYPAMVWTESSTGHTHQQPSQNCCGWESYQLSQSESVISGLFLREKRRAEHTHRQTHRHTQVHTRGCSLSSGTQQAQQQLDILINLSRGSDLFICEGPRWTTQWLLHGLHTKATCRTHLIFIQVFSPPLSLSFALISFDSYQEKCV